MGDIDNKQLSVACVAAFAYDRRHRLSEERLPAPDVGIDGVDYEAEFMPAAGARSVTAYTYYADNQIETVTTPPIHHSGGGELRLTTTYSYNGLGLVATEETAGLDVAAYAYYPTGTVRTVMRNPQAYIVHMQAR